MMPSLEQARSWPSRLRGDAKQSPAAFGLATILAIGIALTAIIYLPFAARTFDVLDLGHTEFPEAVDLDLQDRLLSNRQERLGDRLGERPEPRSQASGQDHRLHLSQPCLACAIARLSLLALNTSNGGTGASFSYCLRTVPAIRTEAGVLYLSVGS